MNEKRNQYLIIWIILNTIVSELKTLKVNRLLRIIIFNKEYLRTRYKIYIKCNMYTNICQQVDTEKNFIFTRKISTYLNLF